MGSQHVEFESEAWYRAIAEGRLTPVSDGNRGPAIGRDPVATAIWGVPPGERRGPTALRLERAK